jgi:nitrogen fixation protein NifU and related proteins
MSDLKALYQEVILDHNRNPRNFGKLESANHRAEGHNPLCGDRLTVYADLEGDRIADLKFEGSGCAISKASASIMTTELKQKSTAEANAIFEKFHRMVTGEIPEAEVESLGKLAAFSGVREFPVRVKCASLPWHTLQAALRSSSSVPEPVSTEE